MSEKTTSVQIVMPQHCNGYAKPRLFGGQIMAWIDVVGAVAARRYTGHAVTTVCVDNLTFLKPAYLNDTVVQEAWVTWTGRTSLEVRVDSMVEKLDGTGNSSTAPMPYLSPWMMTTDRSRSSRSFRRLWKKGRNTTRPKSAGATG